LDDTFDDEKLRELFADFGTITSCKVSWIWFLVGQSLWVLVFANAYVCCDLW
jgi:hypothetical protein